ncbi:hypothetical protein VFPPC_17936 [Pochonia chlamydosporia 170]|uniref:Uncharacterized protein n=1 Tax=Pochonia chlamydosporia 170 TaxID=1380566 RepID=A0A219AQ70_METCM|nr:hypothetical protein VFPPC_17936 [Pochonia chlamydosporia 170]OWT42871.1 hypothetical protein VFPPC_17936 [Pochonia chlamydosporia 170]
MFPDAGHSKVVHGNYLCEKWQSFRPLLSYYSPVHHVLESIKYLAPQVRASETLNAPSGDAVPRPRTLKPPCNHGRFMTCRH